MSKPLYITSLLAVMLGLIVLPMQAQKPKKQPKKKAEAYSVIAVDDELQVVSASGLKNLKKKAEIDHKAAMKAWTEAKRQAKKEKTKFTDPSPKKAKISLKKGNFKSQIEANAYLDELKEKARKKEEKAGKKKEGGRSKKAKGSAP